MADRTDYFFRQKVTEAELDLGFELLEKADRNLAADLGIHGIISGALPTPRTPVPDLSISLSSPSRAYDRLGRRVFVGNDQTVDCSSDHEGLPTAVPTPGEERWLAVFVRFDRQLSDPRTDGNSQQVFFRRDESYRIVVRQAAAAVAGSALRVPLQPEELLVCDILLAHGQTQITGGDIETGRRQAFVFMESDAVSVDTGGWQFLAPPQPTVQATLNTVDDVLDKHLGGTGHRHPASHIDFTPSGFLSEVQVQAALTELITRLTSVATGDAGVARIGADGEAGTPYALPPGTARTQLAALLGWLNAHVGAVTGAHDASAIAALTHEYITSTNVQAQLEEIVSDLKSTNPSLGAAQVGSGALSGTPYNLANGTARSQLSALLAALNSHAGGTDHDTRYWQRSETVDNADTVDGLHAAAFSLASHNHDSRYMRRVFLWSDTYSPGQLRTVITLPDRPDIVTYSYNHLSGGLPLATTYVNGQYSKDIRVWVTKLGSGASKTFEIEVHNNSAVELYINIAAYQVD